MMQLKPLADHIVVKVINNEERTKSGLILPDTAQEKPQMGEVIAVGSGKVLENGQKLPLEVKVGDKIIFAKYAGSEIKLDGDPYVIFSERDVLAVVEK